MFLLVKLKKSVSGLSQPQEAAVLADEYILPHKSTFGGGGVNAQQKLFIPYK